MVLVLTMPRMEMSVEPELPLEICTLGIGVDKATALVAPEVRSSSPPIAVMEMAALPAGCATFCAVMMTSARRPGSAAAVGAAGVAGTEV